MHKATILSLLW